MAKKFRHKLENAALAILLGIVRILPYRWSVGLGGAIGGLIWRLGIRESVSFRNFELCFPDIDRKTARKILRESYRNFCRSMAEFALLPKLKGKTLDYVEFSGLEEALDITAKGDGMLLVTGHFGSWELLGAALSETGFPLDFLVGEQTNATVDDLINGIRSEMGIGIIHMGVAARGVIKSVRSGRAVAMLSDQDAGKSSTIVNFFGNPASTPSGIGAFALKLQCPIMAGGIVRQSDKTKHKVEIEIIYPDYAGLPEDKDLAIAQITQAYTDCLEKIVRENPEMYFWPHRRFKSTLGYK
jgi:KDO2-lipid IV(A) lauroyltransferase